MKTKHMTNDVRKKIIVRSYSLSDEMNFGRYKGFTVKEVIDTDRQYIKWCIKTVEWFELTNDALNYYRSERFNISDSFDPFSDYTELAHEYGLIEQF